MENAAPPNDNELEKWLENDHQDGLSLRLKRLRWLVDTFPAVNGYHWWPDCLAHDYFEDARSCYLHGLFIAWVLTCQAFTEKLLSGLLNLEPGDQPWENKSSMADVLRRLREAGHITQGLAKAIRRLSGLADSYKHARSPLWMSKRVVKADKPPYAVLEEDARFALVVLSKLITSPPFVAD